MNVPRSIWPSFYRLIVATILTMSGCATAPESVKAGPAVRMERIYVGTYTNTTSKGIYLFELDPATGAFTARGLAAEAEDPHFLAIHPNHRLLYAGASRGDANDPPKTGAVDAFAIDPASGKLTLINQQWSGGKGATYVSVDPSGRDLLVANYGSATIAALPIAPDGRLAPPAVVIHHMGSSVNPERQSHAYPHSINPDPTGRFAFVPDLGLDKIFCYGVNPDTTVLMPNDPPFTTVPPGNGPRHMAFSPDGRFAYVVQEMGGAVVAFAYNAEQGSLSQVQIISTLPSDFTAANTAADVHVHPSGKFLYASNRGHDSIAIFAIDPATGRLTSRGWQSTQGKTPRNFAIDETGRWLIAANQGSDSIALFRIDESTGALTPTGKIESVAAPVCVKCLAIAP
jgi:6-phosphogluconolactonase